MICVDSGLLIYFVVPNEMVVASEVNSFASALSRAYSVGSATTALRIR